MIGTCMFHSDNVLRQLSHLATKTVGIRGHAERVAGEAIKTGLIVASTGSMSYVNARYAQAGKSAFEVGNVPVDLAGGLLISALSFADVLGRFDEFGHAVGSGMLGAYFARLGTQYGTEAKVHAASGGSKSAAKGYFGVGAAPLYPAIDSEEVPAEDWAT